MPASSSSPAMASQHAPRRDLDLDAFLPSSPTSSASFDADEADPDHRRAVDDLLRLLSSSDSDSDSEESSRVPCTSSCLALSRVQAPAPPPAEPSLLPASASPAPPPPPRYSVSASPSETLSSLVARTFSSNGSSSSSKPFPSLFRGVRPSPKPGAALAAAAAASRAVLTPHAAAIKSRRSVSAPVEKVLEEEGSGSEDSKELPPTGSLEAEVEEKGNSEAVAEATDQTATGSAGAELGVDEHAEVGGEENAEAIKLVEASSLDAPAAEDSSGHEQGGDVNLAETDQVVNQIEAVYEENGDDQTRDDNHVQSGQDIDLIGVAYEEGSDDEHEFERSDSIMEEQVESGSLIDKVIEERIEQLPAGRLRRMQRRG